MSWVELFAAFVACHLAGDFVLQTDWQAIHKPGGLGRDPVARRALCAHIATYTLCFVPAIAWVAAENGAWRGGGHRGPDRAPPPGPGRRPPARRLRAALQGALGRARRAVDARARPERSRAHTVRDRSLGGVLSVARRMTASVRESEDGNRGGGGLLRSVPVFAGLSDEQRERLAEQAREVKLDAGDWLLREGEEGETTYVIRSGRLDVVTEGPPETLIRTIRRGDVVGELALLHAGRRTASVRARRNAELLELSRSQFEQLIREEPSFAIALTRSMGAQLAAIRSPLGSAALASHDRRRPARLARTRPGGSRPPRRRSLGARGAWRVSTRPRREARPSCSEQ